MRRAVPVRGRKISYGRVAELQGCSLVDHPGFDLRESRFSIQRKDAVQWPGPFLLPVPAPEKQHDR